MSPSTCCFIVCWFSLLDSFTTCLVLLGRLQVWVHVLLYLRSLLRCFLVMWSYFAESTSLLFWLCGRTLQGLLRCFLVMWSYFAESTSLFWLCGRTLQSLLRCFLVMWLFFAESTSHSTCFSSVGWVRSTWYIITCCLCYFLVLGKVWPHNQKAVKHTP
jgi:hypothetical protein